MSNFVTAPKQDAYSTELSSSVNSSTTTITVVDAPDFTLGAGESVYGVIDPKNSSREGVQITAISGNDLTVTRGLPAYDGGASTATSHSGGATFIISDNWQTFDDAATAINTKLNTNGDNADDAIDISPSGNDFRIRYDGGDMKFTDDNQSEVTLSVLAAAGGADEKSKVSANDTTAGYLNGKLVAGDNVTFVEDNDGANETLTISADSNNETVEVHATYTPGFLTGGSSAESNTAIWDSVSDGEFAITVDGTSREVTGLDFTTVASMADVANVIQVGLRAATSSTETVVWSTDHFVITSVNTTSSSAVSVTSTVAAPAGTDISGAGASDYMDCDTGNGTPTAAVLDPTADDGKVPELNSNGNVDPDLLREVIPSTGYTAKGQIVISSAADTPAFRAVGNDGEVLVADSTESTGHGWGLRNSLLEADATNTTVANTTTETDLWSTTLHGGSLGSSNAVTGRIYISGHGQGTGGSDDLTVNLNYGTTTVATLNINGQGTAFSGLTGYIDFSLMGNGGTSVQEGIISFFSTDQGGFATQTGNRFLCANAQPGTGAEDSTTDLTLSVSVQWGNASSSNTIKALHTVASLLQAS